jgi:hypothetical protein
MRAIKFRAWDKDLLKMYEWGHIKTGLMHAYFDGYYNVDLMQFTGLIDKNGKEIYEGDIVKQFGGYEFTVEFKNGVFWLAREGRCDYPVYAIECIEIIGNIWEATP